MRVVSRICIALLVALLLQQVWAQSPVTAEAADNVNIRSDPAVWGDELGKMAVGTQYPVIGRSELTPWVLLGDPTTGQPIGWAFMDIITVRGSVESVPLSTITVTAGVVPPTPTLTVNAIPGATAAGGLTPVPPMTLTLGPGPTATQPALSGVTGTVANEVNIRYGPGADYPRVGVAQAGNTFEILSTHSLSDFVQIRYENAPNRVAWVARNLMEITGDLSRLPIITDPLNNLPTLTPTASVVNASARPNATGTEVPVSPAFAVLGDQLWSYMLGQNFDPATERFGALFVLDLQTKEAFTFGNNVAFSGTSVNKISILARLYATLNNPPDRALATDIANTMICSENVATNRLLSAIGAGDEFKGAEEVTRFLSQLGLKRSFLLTPYVTDPLKPPVSPRPLPIPITGANQTKANPDLTNQLTVEEMGWLLEDIYQCGYENAGPLLENFGGQYESRECRQMLHVMSNNTVDALLKAGVPTDTRVAHKHGWIEETHSNAAVFFTPGGNYIIVVMMYQPVWLSFDDSLPTMAEMSREVYNYYNPTAPMAAIREGFIPLTEDCNFAGSPLVNDLMQVTWEQ